MGSHLTIETSGKVSTITLIDIERRNCLSTAMFDEFQAALSLLESDPPTVVRLRASGRAFCAGFNLDECLADHARLGVFIQQLSSCIARIRSSRGVWVAEVQGAALAGGCALACSCDVVIASRAAQFGYPVHRIGVSPAVSLATLLPAIGAGNARYLTLSGEIITAERAHSLGLVHQLADDSADLSAQGDALALDLTRKGPEALIETKVWLNRLDLSADASVLGACMLASRETCESEECRRLLQAAWSKKR